MAKFAVGEICDVWGTLTNRWYECSIVALLGGEPHAVDHRAYVIHIPDYPVTSSTSRGRWGAFEWQLRKRKPRPPERECDKLVPWDDCLWRPKARVTT